MSGTLGGLATTARRAAWLWAVASLGACGGEGGEGASEDALDVSVGASALTVEVGPEGAVLELEAGMRLTVPRGALEEPVEMRVRRMEVPELAEPPARDGRRLEMPVVIEPHGLELRRNASIELAVMDGEVRDESLRVFRLDDETDETFERLEHRVLQPEESSPELQRTEVRREGDDMLVGMRRVEVSVDRFSVFVVTEAASGAVAPMQDGGAGGESDAGAGGDAGVAPVRDGGGDGDGSVAMDAASERDGGALDSGSDTGGGAGDPDGGAAVALLPSDFYRRIAAGSETSAYIDDNGKLWAFGRNTNGQLGTGSPRALVPTPLRSVEGLVFVHLVGGNDFFLALTASGDLYSWGYDGNGQQGNGAGIVEEPVPHLVMGRIVSVDAEGNHILALDDQGRLWEWGGNIESPTQVDFTPPSNLVQVAEGAGHQLLLDASGRVWGWGGNGNDRLGGTSQPSTFSEPVLVLKADDATPFDDARFVATSNNTSFVIDAAGQLWTFGYDGFGTTGQGTNGSGGPPAVVATSGTPGSFERVHGFEDTAVAVDDRGTAWGFGRNQATRVLPITPLDCSGNCVATATAFEGSATIEFVDVVVGVTHGLGLDAGGQLWSWGRNTQGQLGDGTVQDNSTQRATPAEVRMPDGRRPQALFGSHAQYAQRMSVVYDSGELWSFGQSELVTGASTQGPSPARIAGLEGRTIVSYCGASCYSVAVDDTGAVWTYGDSCGQGELGVVDVEDTPITSTTTWLQVQFPEAASIEEVACSNNTVYARTDAGLLWAWGDDFVGQLGDADDVHALGNYAATPVQVHAIDDAGGVLSGVVDIDAAVDQPSNEWAVALLSDGSVVVWGSVRASGQLGRAGDPACGGSCVTYPVKVCGLQATELAGCLDGAGLPDYLTGMDEIAAADGAIYARAGNTLYSWGDNYHGMLGQGDETAPDSGFPAPLAAADGTPGNFVQVVGGNHFGLALDDAGDVWSWGSNAEGEQGRGDQTLNCNTGSFGCEPVPTKILALDAVNVVYVDAGRFHAAAVDDQGRVYAWGRNSGGEAGQEGTQDVLAPAEVLPLPR